ncbi:MAG: NYN domain-containing protein [Dehalococcoidia bacterium]
MKVNVYVDGFNLYYGSLQSSPYKWLDLGAFCRRVLTQDQINRIRYFTAHITDCSGSHPAPVSATGRLSKRQRQQMYLRALGTVPNLTIHYGHYLAKTKRRPLVTPIPGIPRTVEIHDSEEKGSDVNLATYLLLDAFDADCEAAVVISNDSDLVLPIRKTSLRFYPVGVLNPHKYPSNELRKAASFHRQIHPSDLAASQFPPTLTDARGTITKPSTW